MMTTEFQGMDPTFGNGLGLFRLRYRRSGWGGGVSGKLVSEHKENTNPHYLSIEENNKWFQLKPA